MFSKLRTFLDHPFVRMAALSAVAGAGSYFIGQLIPYVDAAIAGVTALVTIRPTFHDAAREMVRQIGGTFIGALIGVALTAAFGFSPLVIAATVLTCFLLGWPLKLSEPSLAVMSFTALIVAAPVLNTSAVESRFAGVALGAVCALVVSLWVLPGKPHSRALVASVERANASAELLSEVSIYLSEHRGKVSKKVAREWVARAEGNMSALADVRADAEGALRSARWSPLVDKEEAQAVLEQVALAQVTARTVYNMSQDLLLHAKSARSLPVKVVDGLASVMAATAETISGQADGALETPAQTLANDTSVLSEWESHRDGTAEHLSELDSHAPVLLAGSLLRDAEKIADVLSDDQEQ
jgi:uncharacterized membrane protein YgaE (UPF0421/DUF939 family)